MDKIPLEGQGTGTTSKLSVFMMMMMMMMMMIFIVASGIMEIVQPTYEYILMPEIHLNKHT